MDQLKEIAMRIDPSPPGPPHLPPNSADYSQLGALLIKTGDQIQQMGQLLHEALHSMEKAPLLRDDDLIKFRNEYNAIQGLKTDDPHDPITEAVDAFDALFTPLDKYVNEFSFGKVTTFKQMMEESDDGVFRTIAEESEKGRKAIEKVADNLKQAGVDLVKVGEELR